MDDRRALMAACIANPDEDTPRLALADWLQEHGDNHDQARAEFIRLQIQAAGLPEGDAARTAVEATAKTLEEQHRAVWLAALTALGWGDELRVPFRRGFLGSILFRNFNFFQDAMMQSLPDALAMVGVEGFVFVEQPRRVKD